MRYSFVLLAFYSLAVYRLALMLSSDLGPWSVFEKLRSFLKREAKHNKPLRDSKFHVGIDCIRCDSVWLAIPVAAYAAGRHLLVNWVTIPADIFLSAMALSAIAVLLNRIPKK